MAKRRARHKSRRALIPASIELSAKLDLFYERRQRWVDALQNTPVEYWVFDVAEALARFNLEPNEWARPIGELPPIVNASPLVYLNRLIRSLIWQADGSVKTFDTLEWKADILKAASLVWAGVIDFEDDQIKEVAPLADKGTVMSLLAASDLERFWNRRGVGMTKTDIAAKHINGEDIVDTEQLRDWLRKYK